MPPLAWGQIEERLFRLLRHAESGGDAIRIARVVVVRTTVRVDIAEVIGVVVIRRPQPPITGRGLTEAHPYIESCLPFLVAFQQGGKQPIFIIYLFTQGL